MPPRVRDDMLDKMKGAHSNTTDGYADAARP